MGRYYRAWTAGVCAAVAMAAGWGLPTAQAIDLSGIQAAALDQPQINVVVYVGQNTVPLIGQTTTLDPDTLEEVTINVFTYNAFLDTGASGILISTPTKNMLSVPVTSTIYSDVGVAGSDNFQVSQLLRISLANFTGADLNQFSDVAQTQPILTPFVPLPAPNASVRVEVGPYVPTVDNPVTDDLDLLLQEFNAVDVVGMPAMQGRVVVIDPKPLKNLLNLLSTLDIDQLDDFFNHPEQFTTHTFIYAPGTPFNPAAVNTNPGIPSTQRHVKLSYGSFDRFTTVTPSGQPGPNLTHNPFIGKDPVRLLDGTPQPNVPGIKITRGGLSSEGNWLLDTGAAATIISTTQALALGVHYRAGTQGTDNPILETLAGVELPDQFTLLIGGIGGQSLVSGFTLDTLLLRTMEGDPLNDNDPNHIRFEDVKVLVGDITVKDPVTGQTITLDGIFGMNLLFPSIDVDSEGLPNFDTSSLSAFDWITFDEPNGILGLSFDPDVVVIPEPASLAMLGGGILTLGLRRRVKKSA